MDNEVLLSFTSEIEVFRASEKNGKKYITGIASSTSRDDYNTIFAESAQVGFVEDCQNSNIIVELYHQEKNNHPVFLNIGKVVSASVVRQDGKTSFQVEIEIKPTSSLANDIWNIIQNPDPSFGDPVKFGMSIHGIVTKSHYEYVDNIYTKIYDRVSLRRIAIVDNPSNTDTFAEAVARESAQTTAEVPSVEQTANQIPEVKPEEVSRDTITLESDWQSATSMAKQFAGNNTMNNPVVESPTPTITATELKAKMDTLINEMVKEVKVLQVSGLMPENVLMLMDELVEKYEDEISCLKWDTQYCDVVDDTMESDSVERSSKISKELSDSIKSKIGEIKNARQSDKQSDTSVARSTSKQSNTEHGSELQQHTSTIQQDQSKQVETVTRESVSNWIKEAMTETVTTLSKETTSLVDSLKTEFKAQMDKINQDFNSLKKQPASMPANLVGLISRSSNENSISDMRARLNAGEKLTQEEITILQRDALKSFGR